MNASRRVEIRSQKRLFDDFFKIDELIVLHQRYDGSMSGAERRLVFERGDAVAVLLFDADARSVVLVEQFRPPTLIAIAETIRPAPMAGLSNLLPGRSTPARPPNKRQSARSSRRLASGL